MKKLFKFVSVALLLCTSIFTSAQTLEDVIVETYSENGIEGQTTYRVFLDMGENDLLLAVFALDDEVETTGNDILFETTTTFYQDPLGGNFGEGINSLLFAPFPSVAYDTWVSVGAAATGQAGIPLSQDSDGSALTGFTPDGFTSSTVAATNSVGIVYPGGNLVSSIATDDGAYFIAGGASGVGEDNVICIGQFTTDGEFSFRFNVLLQNGDDEILFLHTNEEQPDGATGVVSPLLTFPITGILGCTNNLACNFNVDATLDDGSCILPEANCTVCNDENDGLVLIDSDNDGICDAEEIEGCTNPQACNFDALATDDDGSCTDIPVDNCTLCVGSELVVLDSDNDGVCNADDPCPDLANLVNGDECITNEGEVGTIADCECVVLVIEGCTSPTACNFDPNANSNDGTCIEPVENCTECNEENDGLVLIDDDGDGVCNADEVAGCTNELSCNFNPEATDDDGTCTDEPVESCTECVGADLVLIDSDGDGICDGQETPGCTDEQAVNFNPAATDDDGSCIFEAVISLLDFECEQSILQITDAHDIMTNGGLATSETRTLYAFGPDEGNVAHTYAGDEWPYVLVPGGVSFDDNLVEADITVGANDILLIDGRPVYQFSNDLSASDANGNFGPWSYLSADGTLTQDPCLGVGTLDQEAANSLVEVFPNPVNDVLTIRWTEAQEILKASDLIEFQIFDVRGRLIYVQIIDAAIGVLRFNTDRLDNGQYIVKMVSESQSVQKRFVVTE